MTSAQNYAVRIEETMRNALDRKSVGRERVC